MRLRIKQKLRIIIPVIIVIGIVLWIVIWSYKPHEGVISNPPQMQTPKVHTTNKLDGTYISFEYSGKYTARQDVPRNEAIEMYTLNADTRYDKRILASVVNLPDGRIGSYAAFIYREKTPTLYTSRKVQVQGATVEVWTKIDGTEQTVFIPHNDKLATISFVTSNTSDQLTGEMDNVLKTFQWKK